MSVITKEKLEGLLGRTLSTNEFEKHLDNAVEQLEAMLGVKISGTSGQPRTYGGRKDYHSLFVDPFIGKPTVTTERGTPLEVANIMQGDNYNSDWFNTIVMRDWMDDTPIVVKADWGYGKELPAGLSSLLAGVFDIVSSVEFATNTGGAVKSEAVLSHSVTYDTTKTALEHFAAKNSAVIAKYGRPIAGIVRHGGCR